MDTGLLYRAVALNLWRWGGDLSSEFEALRACDVAAVDPDDPEIAQRAGVDHRLAGVGLSVGPRRVARPPAAVRRAARRGGARRPRHRHRRRAGRRRQAFVTASAEVRAQRRVRELLERGLPAHYDDVLIDIRARDERDSSRAAAPLRQAEDATRARHQRARRRAGDRAKRSAWSRSASADADAGGQHRWRQIIRTVGRRTREFGPFRV